MFDEILGSYYYPPVLRHDQQNKKSFLFLGDRWQCIGDIEFFAVQTDDNTANIYMRLTDPNVYAQQHSDEGAVEWLAWGTRMN